MILYFSSTGNCRYVAEQLALSQKEKAVSILETAKVHLASGEKLGFVFPTYFWRLPIIVDNYMKSVRITSEDPEPYIYFIATYGTTCGQTGGFMKQYLQKKGYRLSACFSIKTVDDWTVWFDLSDPKKVSQILQAEIPQIQRIIGQVNNGVTGNYMKNTLPMIAVLGSFAVYSQMRKTKHLHAGDDCIGCGLCARECPVSAIEMQADRPVWVKKQCAMCLHCLHSCPKFAIGYDNATQNHGQYQHP